MEKIITDSFNEMTRQLTRFIQSPAAIRSISDATAEMATAIKTGHKIIACGNGGSLCDATHFAEELTGRYRCDRNPLPAIAINDPAYITCTANDFSFDSIYSRYVEAVGLEGDVLLAISTSGKSPNIVNAACKAHEIGMKVIALTSDKTNPLTKIADISIGAPASEWSDRIQEIHIKVIHIMVQGIEHLLNP